VSEPGFELPLNVNQRHHFDVLLASLEDALARIEELAGAPRAVERQLTELADDVGPGFLREAHSALERARARLHALATAMRVEPRAHSRQRTIEAILTSQIVQLEGSDARRLRAYGAVDPRLAGLLDPQLEALEADLAELRAILRAHAEHRRGNAAGDR